MEKFTVDEESGIVLHNGYIAYMNGNPINNPDIVNHGLTIKKRYSPGLNIISVKGHVTIIGKDIEDCFDEINNITYYGRTYPIDGLSYIVDIDGKMFMVGDTEINSVESNGTVPFMGTFIIPENIHYRQLDKYKYSFSPDDSFDEFYVANIFDYKIKEVKSKMLTLFNDSEEIKCIWGFDQYGMCLYDNTNKRRLNIGFKN